MPHSGVFRQNNWVDAGFQWELMQQSFNGTRVFWNRSRRHVYFCFGFLTSKILCTKKCESSPPGMPFMQSFQIELYWIVLCECPLRSIETQMRMLIWKKSSFCASGCTLAKGYKGSRTTPMQGGVCALYPVLGRKLWRSLRHMELLKYIGGSIFLVREILVSCFRHSRFYQDNPWILKRSYS